VSWERRLQSNIFFGCAEPITREIFNEEMSAKTEAKSRAPAFAWFVAEDSAADAQSEDEMDVRA
jgi:hypothetical protein